MKTLPAELFVVLILASALAQATGHDTTAPSVASPDTAAASAPAVVAPETIKPAEPQVYVGDAHCDLKEQVNVAAVADRPGHYDVRHRKARYRMVAERTPTGAIKLRDPGAGFIWLQIPSTSMLLNEKIGQRVASNCQSAEQLKYNAANEPDPANSLGIEKKGIQ